MQSNSSHRSAWFILLVVFLASVAASLNQFKVPPVLPLLMDTFSLPIGKAGLLMSVFAITGLILAIPAGFVFQKLGYRDTGLIALYFLIIGSALGALTNGVGTMLISRFIEGAGMSFISVVAPAIITLRFAAERRGKAMGIWATWVPVGSTLMFIIAPALAGWWSWQGVWWFGCSFAVAVGLLYYFSIRPPQQDDPSHERVTGRDLKGVLRNRNLWLISFLFGCFNLVFISFVTWTPTFLHEVHGTSLANASLVVSLISILSMASCPLAGWISDKIGSRKLVCVIPMILMMVLLPLSSIVRAERFFLLVIAIGMVVGFVPAGVFPAGSEVVGDKRLGGMAMAIVQIGQNAGMLLGPLLFGWVVESFGGWSLGFWTLAPVCGVGAIAGWMAKMR